MPPLPWGAPEWSGNAPSDTDWDSLSNWLWGFPPQPAAPVLFGNSPGTEQATVTTGTTDRVVSSLWFEAGTFYDIGGDSQIILNGGAFGGYLVVQTSDGTRQSEAVIKNDLNLLNGPSGFGLIENWSEAGLNFDGKFILGDKNVRFGGSGAMRLGNTITGKNSVNPTGTIEVAGTAPLGPFLGTRPQLVLSSSNENWGGDLLVQNRGSVIIKADQALGYGSNKTVFSGGSLSFRSHRETPLTYGQPTQNDWVSVQGLGIKLTEDTHPIGAIYNDGGMNSFDMRIRLVQDSQRNPVSFGARGDRSGGLDLSNQILGDNVSFFKLGPGLIILSNDRLRSEANYWDKETTLADGVLRLGSSGALPQASNLVIRGGILELGHDDFSRELGTGANQLRWTADGGFSAHGANRSVTINIYGNTLTWADTQYFLGSSSVLHLSSRYADHAITFTNAINLNGALREVRVERGEDAAHAVLDGNLSSTGGGLIKTGAGLLRLRGGSNSYTGATVIRDGVLRVPDVAGRGLGLHNGTNIELEGGILGLNYNGTNFIRSLGIGGNQIRWTGSGGFAAYNGGEVRVQLGSSNQTVNWGAGHFVGNGDELRFGHYSANGTIVWENPIALGNGSRTIRIERGQQAGADVELRSAMTGGLTSHLFLVGNGRIDITRGSWNMVSNSVQIYGAELRVHGPGFLSAVNRFDIRYGGTLALENTTSIYSHSRIGSTVGITLAAGNLHLSTQAVSISQRAGNLTLDSGANTIALSRDTSRSLSTELYVERLLRNTAELATLHIEGDLSDSLLRFRLNQSASSHASPTGSTGIIPWGTNADTWLIAHSASNTEHYLKPLVTYYELGQSGWAAAHNVRADSATTTLSENRTINSLILDGDLALGDQMLILNSGGLMITGNRTIDGTTNTSGMLTTIGTITTAAANRPLYIHNSGSLTFDGNARLSGNMDVVKTRTGSLILNSDALHQIGSLYIHQGTIDLRDGTISIGPGNEQRIYIGDGAGTDRLILPGNRWDPLVKTGGGRPSITLRGTPYDPRGPEYGGDQAILQLGGNTKQHLANLRIENQGTIDFRGGEVGQANILWIDSLTFNNDGARLFVRNWYDFEDMLLIHRFGFHTDLLRQIVFEGYPQVTYKDYDQDYFQIIPAGYVTPTPEPSTYGAILGAVGLGLVVWKRKRRHGTSTK